jgi:hypothetical protein
LKKGRILSTLWPSLRSLRRDERGRKEEGREEKRVCRPVEEDLRGDHVVGLLRQGVAILPQSRWVRGTTSEGGRLAFNSSNPILGIARHAPSTISVTLCDSGRI